ncbi:MAG: hypothetical protein R2748_32640 [Bryobacterales bacterium]
MLREGVVGDVYMVRGLCCHAAQLDRPYAEEEPPPLRGWTGRSSWDPSMRPYTKNRFAYNWHWFWDTGNGDRRQQGVHEMDISRWALGLRPDDSPIRATSSWTWGFVWQDDQETPNTQQALFDFPGKEIYFDVRNLDTNVELPAVMGKVGGGGT